MTERFLKFVGLLAVLVCVLATPAFATTDNASPVMGTVRDATNDNAMSPAIYAAAVKIDTPQVGANSKFSPSIGFARQFETDTRSLLATATGAFSGKNLCLHGQGSTIVNPQPARDNFSTSAILANAQWGELILTRTLQPSEEGSSITVTRWNISKNHETRFHKRE
ncbi:MAG: hypothetical protein HZA95_04280 [Candidatus Vogelbacteria bacterium]|nr:hypothetical protein [Candidatus Vogelbacteria bacterium]